MRGEGKQIFFQRKSLWKRLKFHSWPLCCNTTNKGEATDTEGVISAFASHDRANAISFTQAKTTRTCKLTKQLINRRPILGGTWTPAPSQNAPPWESDLQLGGASRNFKRCKQNQCIGLYLRKQKNTQLFAASFFNPQVDSGCGKKKSASSCCAFWTASGHTWPCWPTSSPLRVFCTKCLQCVFTTNLLTS